MAEAKATIGIRLESTAIVRPGDTLIVAVNDGMTYEAVDRLCDHLAEHLPGVRAVVITANDLAVYQPADTQEATR